MNILKVATPHESENSSPPADTLSKDEKQELAPVLPVLLPPATLRPLAFRTLTKRHGLTLTSSSLEGLSLFVGKNCGLAWREDASAERTLNAFALLWKSHGFPSIVDGSSKDFEICMRSLKSQCAEGQGPSVATMNLELPDAEGISSNDTNSEQRRSSRGCCATAGVQTSILEPTVEKKDNAKNWLRVLGAFDDVSSTVGMVQNPSERRFGHSTMLPHSSHKTALFRQRFLSVYQRILRNHLFDRNVVQEPMRRHSGANEVHHITSIANLLGRHGSSHVILGILSLSITGFLTISDMSGNVALDLQRAIPVPSNGVLFTPGMIVVVEGVYQEGKVNGVASLGSSNGVGGAIGGKFIALTIGSPPCERREVTLSAHRHGVSRIGQGSITRKNQLDCSDDYSGKIDHHSLKELEQSLSDRNEDTSRRMRIVVLGEVNLDTPRSLQALRKVLQTYAAEAAEHIPLIFVLCGNFCSTAAGTRDNSGSFLGYAVGFEMLANTLSDYPEILQCATFIFVPGDNDPWPSSFSGGAATILPRSGIPGVFTSKVQKAFSSARNDKEIPTAARNNGEAIWTTNPSRLNIFGSFFEAVIFRDDLFGRLRRNSLKFSMLGREGTLEHDSSNVAGAPAVGEATDPDVDRQRSINAVHTGRTLVKTILDQGFLSPLPSSVRPIHWDFAASLQLLPVPSAIFLIDAETEPFSMTYEGCDVMNPGRLIQDERKGLVSWIEYNFRTRSGKVIHDTI